MKKTIWKYPITPNDVIKLEMPKNAEILTVQEQQGTPCIWALVSEFQPLQFRTFQVFGTGHIVPDCDKVTRKYIGTFQLMGGGLVFHLFEIL